MSSQFIEKYEVLETLGKGSMGVVYKARDPEIGRLVAIKTLKSVFLSDDAVGQEAFQRFRQESRSAGRLHHPNIVTIFEAGRSQNGSPYIVMEYIEGMSLEAIVKDRGAIEPLEAFHYLAQTASAIDYALSQNVIHRDIKPSNIIIDLNHRPFLLDFGVAKLNDTSLTPAGTVVGTPSYMSPEQIRGEALDTRSDLFSFAVVTYEVLTGKRPFPGNDFASVVAAILQRPPLSFSEVGCALPKYLEGVLIQGLAREREKRFPTASALIDAAAQTLGIAVDNTGLIGGYRAGMKLTELATGEHGGRVRAPTVYQGISSYQGAGGGGGSAPQLSGSSAPSGAAASPGTPGALTPGFVSNASAGSAAAQPFGGAASGAAGAGVLGENELTGVMPVLNVQANGQRNDSGDSPPRSDASGAPNAGASVPPGAIRGSLYDSAEGDETRLITRNDKLFEEMAARSKDDRAKSGAVPGAAGDRPKKSQPSRFSGGRFQGEGDPQGLAGPGASQNGVSAKSAAPKVVIGLLLVALLGLGGVWVIKSSRNAEPDEQGDGPKPEQGATSSGAVSPDLPASPVPSPAVSASSSSGSSQPEAAPSAAPGLKQFTPVKPQIPAGGFTASQLSGLKDEELAWLLSEQQQDTKMMRLVIAEAGTRKNSELVMRLVPISMHQDYAVRIEVIKALSRSDFRSNSEVMAIIIAALSDSEFLVRGFAAKTLAAIGTPEAVKALEQRVSEEKNQVVLKVIQDALATLKKERGA